MTKTPNSLRTLLSAYVLTTAMCALFIPAAWSAMCIDGNGDGTTSAFDAQLALNQAVGLTDCGRMRIVVIPDTQLAVESRSGQLEAQIDWLLQERPDFVAHVGDIVQHGDVEREWRYAGAQFGRLDGVVPYGLAVGNHDQDPPEDPSEGSTTKYRRFFGSNRFAATQFSALFDRGDSHASLVGTGLLVLFIEFGAASDPDLLEWARGIIADHPERLVAIVTHHAVNAENTGLSPDGQAIANNLADLPNLRFVFAGHVHTGELNPPYEGCIENRATFNGVWFITHNCQADGRNGAGWLRIYDIDTRAKTLSATTYSPWLRKFDKDEQSKWVVEYGAAQ